MSSIFPFWMSETFFSNLSSLLMISLASISCDETKKVFNKTMQKIDTLKIYNIETFADKENIGIWHDNNHQIKKVAAIGLRVSKWIAYHGFSINIDNNLKKYDAIIPCGIKDRGVTNLKMIKDQDYKDLDDRLIERFINNLKNSVF